MTDLVWGLVGPNLFADTIGDGRYTIRPSVGGAKKFALRLQGALIDVFDTISEAQARAELGYQKILAMRVEEAKIDGETGYQRNA